MWFNYRVYILSFTFRKHLQSTFPSMMVDYMSGDELSKHLGRQMSIHNEKYKEPERDEELEEVNKPFIF